MAEPATLSGDAEAPAPFTGMLMPPAVAASTDAPPAPLGGNFQDVITPPPALAAMAKPATDPVEVEARKSIWSDLFTKLKTDQNLQRALQMGLAFAAQPRPIGQTGIGHLANAGVFGTTAYQMGEYAQTEADQKAQAAKDTSEASQAGTKKTAAQAQQEQQAAEVGRQTMQDRVDKIKTEAKDAKFKYEKEVRVEELDKAKREYEKRKLDIAKSIPDEKLRKAAEAEYDDVLAKLDERRARVQEHLGNAGLRSAQASETLADQRKKAAEADAQEMTADLLRNMPDDERKAFLTKTGKYSNHTSGVTQQRDMWGEIYDKLPADSPHKKVDKASFLFDRMSQAKASDNIKILTDYIKAGGDDADLIKMLTENAKGTAVTRAPGAPGTAASGGTASGVIKWERGPDGKPRPVPAAAK